MGDLLITTSTLPISEESFGPRFVLDLAQSLAAYFDQVHILAPAYPGIPDRERWGEIEVHRFHYFWPHALERLCYGYGMVQNVRSTPWLLITLPFFLVCQYLAICKLCKQFPIKWVNSHWLIFQGLSGAMAHRRRKYRHVVHVHAAGLYVLMRLPRWIGRRVAKYILHCSENIICESTYVRHKLDQLLEWETKASISCMGVYTKKFSCTFDSPDTVEQPGHILFVGRFVEKKGVQYLLHAMPLVRKELPDVFLTLVGGGILENKLKQLAHEMNLMDDIVTFTGPQPHHVIAQLFRKARVVAVPSIVDSRGETEGMPTVILEALAAGKRVVASRVNGTPDVVHHLVNGWLCEPQNPTDLANKLVQALRYDKMDIAHEAVETALLYDWACLGSRYAGLIRQHNLKVR